MVKFGKNKFKALNKLAKKQSSSTIASFNKILKKKQNNEKKVTFQKEVLIKETAGSPLVKNVTAKEIIINELSQKSPKKKTVKPKDEVAMRKIKSVEKQKKRQKTQISDTKLLFNLMKKKSK